VETFFVGFITGVLVSVAIAYLFLRISALGDRGPGGYVPAEDEILAPTNFKGPDAAARNSSVC
jgi:hypothetical protein